MKINKDGFYRPVISFELCTNCGKCLNICPNKKITIDDNNKIFGTVINVFSGYAKDKEVRYNSASGGIATSLSLEYIDKGYVICGTSFDHKDVTKTKSYIAINTADIYNFQSSKYMPSEYSEIVKFITTNKKKKIVVIGLPCQIAGIRNIIGYDNNNIILIDIFCGKTMSYKLLHKFLQLKDIEAPNLIEFRDKKSTWFNYSISISNAKRKYSEKFRDSMYGKFLNSKLFTQKACYLCAYGAAGIADITLGDFWDKERFGDEKAGVSLVVARTQKGLEVLNSSNSIIISEENENCLEKTQPHFFKTRDVNLRNNLIKKNYKVLSDTDKYDLNTLYNKHNYIPLKNKIVNKLKAVYRRIK